MIEFLITVINIILLAITKLNQSIIASIYFLYLTLYNAYAISSTDLLSYAFAVSIPAICLVCSLWNAQKSTVIKHPTIFNVSLILFAFCSIQAFLADNSLWMYVYMEASVIPMLLMMYSESDNISVNVIYQYLIYTFISACLLLIAIIQIKVDTKTFGFAPTTTWCYWLIAFASAIKLPIWPFYYWLPTVHGKAPTTCSILLASVILKYSSLIVVRFLLPLPPFTAYIILASIITAICTQCYQKDIKVIFAYSSILHMNLYLFMPLANSITWFTFSLLSHSTVMVLAFLVCDIIKNRYKTLEFNKLTNISNRIWLLMMFAVLYIIDCPLTIGFAPELWTVYSANTVSSVITLLTIGCIVLSSSYAIYMCFVMKDSVCKYDCFKLNRLQYVVIITLVLIIVCAGALPFLNIVK